MTFPSQENLIVRVNWKPFVVIRYTNQIDAIGTIDDYNQQVRVSLT